MEIREKLALLLQNPSTNAYAVGSYLAKATMELENWPDYFADCINIGPKNYLVYSFRSGIKYKVRPRTTDSFTVGEVAFLQEYTPVGFGVGVKDTVVDVGAHAGYFSVIAARQARAGKVYSLEPATANFELLKENISINSLGNVVPINVAAGSGKSTRTLNISQFNMGRHSFYPSKFEESSKMARVDTIGLSDLMKDYKLGGIDFLKLDCEGGEYDFLFSASKVDLAKIEKISMECHYIDSKRNPSTMKSFLEKSGFKIKEREAAIRYNTMIYASR